MSTYRLDKVFAPQSIALVGASAREGSLGRVVLTKSPTWWFKAGWPASIRVTAISTASPAIAISRPSISSPISS